MLKPMPSPRGTNLERIYTFQFRRRRPGFAYDELADGELEKLARLLVQKLTFDECSTLARLLTEGGSQLLANPKPRENAMAGDRRNPRVAASGSFAERFPMAARIGLDTYGSNTKRNPWI